MMPFLELRNPPLGSGHDSIAIALFNKTERYFFRKTLDLKCGLTCMMVIQKQIGPHQADGTGSYCQVFVSDLLQFCSGGI